MRAVSIAGGAVRAESRAVSRAVSIAGGAIRAVSMNRSWRSVSTHMNSWTGMVDHRAGRVMHWRSVNSCTGMVDHRAGRVMHWSNVNSWTGMVDHRTSMNRGRLMYWRISIGGPLVLVTVSFAATIASISLATIASIASIAPITSKASIAKA